LISKKCATGAVIAGRTRTELRGFIMAYSTETSHSESDVTESGHRDSTLEKDAESLRPANVIAGSSVEQTDSLLPEIALNSAVGRVKVPADHRNHAQPMTRIVTMTTDVREQLANERLTGPIHEVQLPLERITTLHGIMIDLDPHLYKPENPYFKPDDDPEIFLHNITTVLERHPLARSAEVRATGSGLHLLIWFARAVQMKSAAEQQKWANIVAIVQRTLPGDPNAPGITAVTRPVDSINSKNDRSVRTLRAGQPIDADAVEKYAERISLAPVREIAGVLLGSNRITPCPVCREPKSELSLLDRSARCYRGCGNVDLASILDTVYAQVPAAADVSATSATLPEQTGQGESHRGQVPATLQKAKKKKRRLTRGA
jgi:hypothetical protein